MDNIIAPQVELAFNSMIVSSRWDVDSVIANSERGGQERIIALFESVSDRNDAFQEMNKTDETRGYNPDKLAEFLVPRTLQDRRSHPHLTNYLKKLLKKFLIKVLKK